MQQVLLRSLPATDALTPLHQGAGSAYFVPDGFIPVLVPDSDDDPDILRRLLEPHFAQKVPVDNLWQTRLPTKVLRPNENPLPDPHFLRSPADSPMHLSYIGKISMYGPPASPSRLIVWQKSVQKKEGGITNNEVSKIVGDM